MHEFRRKTIKRAICSTLEFSFILLQRTQCIKRIKCEKYEKNCRDHRYEKNSTTGQAPSKSLIYPLLRIKIEVKVFSGQFQGCLFRMVDRTKF